MIQAEVGTKEQEEQRKTSAELKSWCAKIKELKSLTKVLERENNSK